MTWDEVQAARNARTDALNRGGVYHWGPLDRDPLDHEGQQAAAAVGLDPDVYRAGVALLRRAPWHILTAWEREEISTAAAYAALLDWERGSAGCGRAP